MSWGAPLLLLTLLLPLLGAVRLWRALRAPAQAARAMQRIAVAGQRLRAPPTPRVRPAFILLLAIALALVALARPRWGDQPQSLYTQTREVMIALDLSRSMLAEDVAPSRLEQARTITAALLEHLNGERVGLIVFAGTSFVQVPLSSDYQIISEFLPLLDPDYMPQGGSDYTGMLNAVLEGFGEDPDADRYLVVLSDGESTTQGWNELLATVEARKIHVLALGLGTEAGGFIRDDSGGYVQDANGDVVHSKLMPSTLQTLARRTHGRYLNASTLDDVRPLLAETVETGRKGRFGEQLSDTRKERFQWLLLPALLMAFLALLREFHQRPRPRAIRYAQPERRRARGNAAVCVLALGAAALVPAQKVTAHFDAEAEFEVREVFDSNPIKRLRAIVRHLAEFDYDAYDLRLMVEETLKYGIDEQRTGLVPNEGVIRDAVEATLQGERLDTSIADWSFYRARLLDMLVELEKAEAEAAAERAETVDEEDTPPTVAGQSTQQAAGDSFGQGASAKTDAALGDLSAGPDAAISRGKKPPPPPQVKKATAAAAASSSGGGGNGPDPILELTKKRLQDVAKRDSPGRLHQLMAETVEQQDAIPSDW